MWCIMGPNDIRLPLNNTSDVSVYGASTGTEVTSGELYWADGQTGVQTISVVVKPYSPGVWHVEKRYYVNVCSIRSNTSLMAAGQISPTAGMITLIVCIALCLCSELIRVATNLEKPGNLEYSGNSLNLENSRNS